MTDKDTDFQGLEAFFQAAQQDAATPDDAFLARLTQQALDTQAGFAAPDAPQETARRPGRLAQFLAAIGGWPAMAGLATAGIAGLWIGAVPPAFVQTFTASVGSSDATTDEDLYLVDPMPGYVLSLSLGDGL